MEVTIDGKLILSAQDNLLKSGGAGIYAEHGMDGIGRFAVEAETTEF